MLNRLQQKWKVNDWRFLLIITLLQLVEIYADTRVAK